MNLPHDRQVAAWLAEDALEASPQLLARALAATRRTRKRPRWSFPERWLPMDMTLAWTRSPRPMLAILTLSLLMLAFVAAVLVTGSRRAETSPLLFRNGAVVYEEGGDLFIADELGGDPRPLVAGPEPDGRPVFSDQGDRVAFVRWGAPNTIMSVGQDGSDVKELARLEGNREPTSLDWSPDGTALLLGTLDTRNFGAGGIYLIQSDGSGSLRLDAGYVFGPSWRPDGRHIAMRGNDGGRDGAFIADADGTSIRHLPGVGDRDLAWSPDGKHLISVTSPSGDGDGIEEVKIADIDANGAMTDLRVFVVDGANDVVWSPDGSHLAMAINFEDASRGTPGIAIADIDQDGVMTDLRRLTLDAGTFASMLQWAPDGSRLAFIQDDSYAGSGIVLPGDSDARRVVIVDPDGSESRLVGPELERHSIDHLAWAPDGQSLVVFAGPDIDSGQWGQVWSLDVATGAHTEVQTPVLSWQRLGP